MNDKRYLAGIIILAALSRLLPHPPNMTPITAVALFSGSKLKGRWSFVIPFLSMLISDLFLGFHATMIFVYGSFLITFLLGKIFLNKHGFFRLALVSLSSSILFFVITNFGAWLLFDMYPHNMSGLFYAYFMAIPFFRNMIVGDMIYVFALFYGYLYPASLMRYFLALKK